MSRTPTARQLDQLLGSRGFARRNMSWNRRSGEFVDVVDLQVSKSADSVTVNVGVFDAEVYRRCWDDEPPSFVPVPSCTVRARIGELMEGGDVWWRLDDTATPVIVASAVEVYALPFLARAGSRAGMAEYLEAADVVRQKYPPPIIGLAILRHDLGDHEVACKLLGELETQTSGGAWSERVRAVARELGCALPG